MKEEQKSRTAEIAAAVRAAHYIYDRPLIFEDQFAIHLTSDKWRKIVKNRFLYWLVAKRLLASLRPVRGQILARSRYAEEKLEKAVSSGVNQYVILGAGLDSFALRRNDLTGTLRVYELDHPGTQQIKRQRLELLNTDIPESLEFVSVDFEKETIVDALSRSTYADSRAAFFSWLGTTSYLTREAVHDTLKAISAYAKSDSEVVLDYGIIDDLIDPSEMATIKKLRKFTQRRGEPLINRFDPRIFAEEVQDLGFELIENLSPEDQMQRYFAGRRDDLRPLASSYLGHLRVRK